MTELMDDARRALTSERRELFLGELLYWLGMAGRGAYVEAGNTAEECARSLRCQNELLLVVAKQLLATLGDDARGYPDDAFLVALAEKATIGGCDNQLHWLLGRALRSHGRNHDGSHMPRESA
jgi:hypothetical protein